MISIHVSCRGLSYEVLSLRSGTVRVDLCSDIEKPQLNVLLDRPDLRAA